MSNDELIYQFTLHFQFDTNVIEFTSEFAAAINKQS